jgi:hypothetical protein
MNPPPPPPARPRGAQCVCLSLSLCVCVCLCVCPAAHLDDTPTRHLLRVAPQCRSPRPAPVCVCVCVCVCGSLSLSLSLSLCLSLLTREPTQANLATQACMKARNTPQVRSKRMTGAGKSTLPLVSAPRHVSTCMQALSADGGRSRGPITVLLPRPRRWSRRGQCKLKKFTRCIRQRCA